MAEWSRVVATTLKEYVKGATSGVLRNRKITALLKDRGRITFNHAGESHEWRVQYKEVALNAIADNETMAFPRTDRWKIANLPWRGYASTDSMTKKEKLMNKSVEALINMYAEIGKLLLKDVKNQFQGEFYIDGNATGNERRLHGIESMTGDSGTPSTSAPIAVASDTYAGLLTTLANYGGAWTGTWPDGTGDAHYDFWSPLLVNFSSTVAAGSGGWTSSTKTWPNTCEEALAYAIVYTQKNRGKEDMLDVFFLDTLLYRQYKDAMRAKERIVVERNQDTGLIKLGFSDVMNQDGTEITSEYGIPASTGYGFNIDQMELMSLQGELFDSSGPNEDFANNSWRYKVDFYGNMKFETPRNFCKLKAYT